MVHRTIYHKEHKFLYFCIFLLFLLSMNLWIGWENRWTYETLVISIVMVGIIMHEHIRLDFSYRNVIPLLVVIFADFYIIDFKIGLLGTFPVPAAIIVMLNKEDQAKCLNYIVKWFAALMIPSVIVYICVQTIGFPSFGKIWVNHIPYVPTSYILRENYLFYEYSPAFYDIRFNGPFVEPGHLGMMSAFLLFATRYEIKRWETWVILVSLFLTLSLSGYVLAVVGYLFFLYDKGKISFKSILLFAAVAYSVYLFAKLYNDGDNILNEYIFSRLEADEEKGFSGNNRVFGEIAIYYAAMFSNIDLLLYGYSEKTIEWLANNNSRGTGYIMWMVQHGVIGTVLAVLFYLIYTLFSKNRKFALLAFAYVLMLFWQRSYPFWFSCIICFVYGITYNDYKRKNEDRNSYLSSKS